MISALVAVLAASCGDGAETTASTAIPTTPTEEAATATTTAAATATEAVEFTLTSTWFEPGGPIPEESTCFGALTLCALDTVLDLAPGATLADLQGAAEDHVLATAEIRGTFDPPQP